MELRGGGKGEGAEFREEYLLSFFATENIGGKVRALEAKILRVQAVVKSICICLLCADSF
jgi:hypothetical protein